MHVRAYDLMTVDDRGLLYGAAKAAFCSGLATGVEPTTDCFGETMSAARTTQCSRGYSATQILFNQIT